MVHGIWGQDRHLTGKTVGADNFRPFMKERRAHKNRTAGGRRNDN
jgi:hypothetical protein